MRPTRPGVKGAGTARQFPGQKAQSGALAARGARADGHASLAGGRAGPDAEPARVEVVGKSPGAVVTPGRGCRRECPGDPPVAGPNARGSCESRVLTHMDPTRFLSGPECLHPTGETTWDPRGRTPQFSCPRHGGRREPTALYPQARGDDGVSGKSSRAPEQPASKRRRYPVSAGGSAAVEASRLPALLPALTGLSPGRPCDGPGPRGRCQARRPREPRGPCSHASFRCRLPPPCSLPSAPPEAPQRLLGSDRGCPRPDVQRPV